MPTIFRCFSMNMRSRRAVWVPMSSVGPIVRKGANKDTDRVYA